MFKNDNMQTSRISTLVTALAIAVGTLLYSCNKMSPVSVKSEGTIYMPRAFSTRGQISLLLVDTPQAVVFGADYGGLKYPGKDITVQFAIDTTAIDAYNKANGTNYIPFPASSYTVPSLAGVIKSGQTSSVPLTVNFVTTGLSRNTNYMLPVTITSISSGILDTSLKTTYFTISDLINAYDGSYTTVGTRTDYNADGTPSGSVSSISDTRVLTTVDATTSTINTIANLGVYANSLFQAKVNADNTVTFSGYVGDTGAPLVNTPDSVSKYDPAAKSFTVHYKYTNTTGTIRMMDEVWTRQ
jgi:hypothetical protein